MKYLELLFISKECPYPDEIGNWGLIKLDVLSAELELLKTILELEWDFNVLFDWFEDNKVKIINEEVPIGGQYDFSIARKIYLFYENDSEYSDEEYDQLFQYRLGHGLRFALRGTDIDDIYIGVNNGKIEISYYCNDNSWAFDIDIIAFYEKLHGLVPPTGGAVL